MPTLRSAAALALGFALAIHAAPSRAQKYPDRPIKIVNPFSPGGSSDTLARTIGQHLQERLGQPVLIESRTGAGGVIGADAVAKSPPDGYTLLGGTSFLPLAVHTRRKLPFDLLKDLTPVTLIGGTSMLLVAHPGLPAQSMAELIALAKSKPGELTYASPGTGTPNHLAMVLLNEQVGVSMRHVPYRSNPLAMNDVIAGHVPLLLDFVSTGAPHVRSGAVRALASTGPTRAKVLPEVPTMMEVRRCRFPHPGMVRDFRPWWHAQGHHHQAERRDRRRVDDARGPGAAGCARCRADRRRTGRACCTGQVRSGDVGPGRREVRHGEGIADMSMHRHGGATVRALATGLIAAVMAFAHCAVAADWPTRSVSIVVPYAPGGGTDIMARLIAQRLTEKYGKPFVVDNRAAPAAPSAPATSRARPPTVTRCSMSARCRPSSCR